MHSIDRSESGLSPDLISSRRTFIKSVAAAATFLGPSSLGLGSNDDRPVKLGLIADLHQDLIHDARERLESFIYESKEQSVDAVIQLGDFATPIPKNQHIIDAFNASHSTALHVIGNHDTDGGRTSEQVVATWGMKNRFYSTEVRGIKLIVLDGNDRPAGHRSGYPAHIAENQIEWLAGELQHSGPMIVLCHQPLAGPSSVDNASKIQGLLTAASDRVLVAINGHTHIDELLEVGGVHYWHVNSAAYYWVGNQFSHESYSPELHAKFPAQSSTCPYRNGLFSFLEVNLHSGKIAITGRESTWVGSSPAELGVPKTTQLESGKQIIPAIRARSWERS
jgi:predicted phosphodiesterase